ncbi:MAG: NAD(P)/FAD-dependent oxidoreductase [Candidatus Hydrothermarchaeales archaeon]
MDYDVVVVGAGPGGSMAAKHLAKEGVDVLLVEKRPEIGTPVRCGEGTGINGLKEHGIEIKKEFIANEINGYCLFSPDGSKVEMPSKESNAYILERRIFDKCLAIEAAKNGAEVRVRTYATGLRKENGAVKGVRLKHFNEEYEVGCDVVVGADGVEGKVGRWAGINTRTRLDQMTSNVQFEMVGIELDAPHSMEFHFGHKVAPGGYAWVFPKGKDVANVGLGVRGVEKTALEYLNEFIESKENLRNGSVIEINTGGVPVQGPIDKSVGSGVVLVGDSARQVDPLTGGGIYNAMHCGVIAGEVIKEAIEKKDFSERFLMEYDRRWRGTIGKGLLRSLKVKNGLQKMSDEDLNLVARAMRELKLGDIDIKDISQTLFRLPPEFLQFVQSLI